MIGLALVVVLVATAGCGLAVVAGGAEAVPFFVVLVAGLGLFIEVGFLFPWMEVIFPDA